ncbi:MAG: NADH-quinone oxidoreductase subunit NuoB [Peptococcaceae bacterium]|nr:NADH-quinone oxidoreductase subunit NuoB [Peptococcaceae bacterium]
MFKVFSALAGSKVVTERRVTSEDGINKVPVIQFDHCPKDCDRCITTCPAGAITKQGVNALHCIYCMHCREICPEHHIGLQDIPVITSDHSITEIGKSLQQKIKKVCRGSLHIRYVDAGACNGCDFEINSLPNPVYDIQQYGVDFVASPRHADMLLITGVVTRNLEIALIKTYEACPKPALVVAVGSCACGGGIFKEAYAAGGGVDKHLPVDVYIPGCPPTPALIVKGILTALDRK